MQLIAVMPLQEAKMLKSNLVNKGVEIELNHAKETCNRGCTVTVEVHANESDIPKIVEVIEQDFQSLIENPDFDAKNLDQVFDPNQSMATCPACTHRFATTLSECPDCGLSFG